MDIHELNDLDLESVAGGLEKDQILDTVNKAIDKVPGGNEDEGGEENGNGED